MILSFLNSHFSNQETASPEPEGQLPRGVNPPLPPRQNPAALRLKLDAAGSGAGVQHADAPVLVQNEDVGSPGAALGGELFVVIKYNIFIYLFYVNIITQ